MTDAIDLRGRRVRLRPAAASDAAALVAIRSTPEVGRWWRGDDLHAEFVEDLADDSAIRLTIEVDDRAVGLIQFAENDDAENRHASVDIYLDPAVHRRGHATDAIATLADHLFDERDHHRLTIDPSVDNAAAIECYRKVGFLPVGVMRSYEQRADESWGDGLLMEMLESDRNPAESDEAEPTSPDPLVFAGTVVNTVNLDALASFYERLLGWERFMDDGDWIAIRPPGGGTAIAFQHDPTAVAPPWPPDPGDARTLVHLDFLAADLPASVSRALELGAAMAKVQPTDAERVLLDPVGNPFCLIPSTSS